MRILIVGAGAVGFHLARHLSEEGHEVVLVDTDSDRVEHAQDQLDIMAITGNGASLSVLEKAGMEKVDLLAAVTNVDEVNLIACMSARHYDVGVKVARISNPDYYTEDGGPASDRLDVDVMINPEFECARETYQLLRWEPASEVASFGDGRIQLVGLPVAAEAAVVGRTLAEIGAAIDDRRFLTVAIAREGRTIIPRGHDRLEAGDRVYLIGESEELPRIFELAGYGRYKLRRVMIGGGSRVGSYLATILEQEDVDCTIIDSDRERCVELAEVLKKSLVLHGNVTDTELLEMEGVEEIDGFVALTGTDDTNMLSSLLAKSHGVRKVVAMIQKLDYIPLVGRVGIDAAVSPRLSTVNAILKYVRRGPVLSVASLRGIDAEVIEFSVSEGSRIAGRRLEDIDFPEHSLVGALLRGKRMIVPSGTDVLEVGDKATVLARADAVKALERLFE